MDDNQYEVGQKVEFTGFTGEDDEMPDNGELLVVGTVYEVGSINTPEDKEDEVSFNLLVDNPDYDSKKRKSKNNQPHLEVDVYGDEIALADDGEEEEEQEQEQEEEKKPARKKAPAKKAAAKPAAKKAEAKEEEEDESEPASKKKAPAKKAAAKPKAKAPAKSKAKAKPEVDDEDLPSDMIILTEEEEDEDVLALVNESDDLCELAHDVCEQSSVQDYRLGGVLYHVRKTKAYQKLSDDYAGKKGFELYCEGELGIKYRKAMYLIDIYAKFNKFGISSDRVAELGWTKCLEIARIMDEDNAEQLIEIAQESTVSELKDTIKETFAEKGKDKEVVKRITFKFRLVEEAGAAVAEYLEQAKQNLGIESDEQVFEHIMTEWSNEHLNLKKARRSKK